MPQAGVTQFRSPDQRPAGGMTGGMNTIHRAPWGLRLRVSTLLVVILAGGIVILPSVANTPGLPPEMAWIVAVLVLAGTAPFTVRGYEIADGAILVHRLFWKTRLPLADLRAAEVEPRAMAGSLRTFGNGGAFSFTGWFWNRRLGRYRAFVTDFGRTVVLRFTDRTIVISPADPGAFVAALRGGGLHPPSRT